MILSETRVSFFVMIGSILVNLLVSTARSFNLLSGHKIGARSVALLFVRVRLSRLVKCGIISTRIFCGRLLFATFKVLRFVRALSGKALITIEELLFVGVLPLTRKSTTLIKYCIPSKSLIPFPSSHCPPYIRPTLLASFTVIS